MARALLGGLSVAGILFAPPWVPLLCMGTLTLRYAAWEVIALGVVIDVLYVPFGGFYGIPMPATTLAFLALVTFEPIRRKLLL